MEKDGELEKINPKVGIIRRNPDESYYYYHFTISITYLLLYLSITIRLVDDMVLISLQREIKTHYRY